MPASPPGPAAALAGRYFAPASAHPALYSFTIPKPLRFLFGKKALDSDASPSFDPRDHIPEELYFLGPHGLLVLQHLLEIV